MNIVLVFHPLIVHLLCTNWNKEAIRKNVNTACTLSGGDMRMCDHMWFFCLKLLINLFFVISYFDNFITWMWSVWCVSEWADCSHRNIVSMLRTPYVKCGCCWQCLCTYSWKRAVCLCDGSRYPIHGCKLRPRWSLGKRSYYTNASFSWKRN